ncbi:MAG: hypothetical protein OXG02_07595 [Chloroflexi bacterium]|nr:hypothetical protein [Chloroflexota bacterium]
MSKPFAIRKVTSDEDLRALIEFPWCLYRDDPNWSPPLLSMRRELLDQEHNPAWQYLDGEYFLAWRGGEVLGSIAAFVNPRHNATHDEYIAWFGLFDCIHEGEVAASLLQTAIDWATQRGYSAIRGPASFTLHAECGLLIDNFGPAVLMMAYNPPYYADFVENAGFRKVMDVFSWAFYANSAEQEAATERALRLAEKLQRREKIHLRTFNPRNRKQEFLRLRHLYNHGWVNNWGFVPMTEAELDALIASLGILIDPNLCIFAEVDGEAIGFVLAIPNLSEILRRVRPRPGVPELISLLPIAWQLKIRRKIECVRSPLMGILPEYHKRGAAIMLMASMAKKLYQSRYRIFDTSWILESNQDMNSMLAALGARKYKTHRFYERKL